MSKKEISTSLFQKVESIIIEARRKIVESINTVMCETYYSIGKMIVIDEQQGESRAKYGAQILKKLSEHLTERFGRGFSVTTLKACRKFYMKYTDKKGQLTTDQFVLSWSHYQFLIQIDVEKIRSFYEKEAYNDTWTVKRLKREYRSKRLVIF